MPLIVVAHLSTPFLMSSIDKVDGVVPYFVIKSIFYIIKDHPCSLCLSALNVQRGELSKEKCIRDVYSPSSRFVFIWSINDSPKKKKSYPRKSYFLDVFTKFTYSTHIYGQRNILNWFGIEL